MLLETNSSVDKEGSMFGIKQPGILLDTWEKNKTWKVLGWHIKEKQ